MLVFPIEGVSSEGPERSAVLAKGRVFAIPAIVDNLVHDARNPLNALSINLELLGERLKRENGGVVPATHQKSLQAIRDQIGRLDEVLRRFTDFLSPRPPKDGPLDLSTLLQQVLGVVGPELRRKRLLLRSSVEPAVLVAPGPGITDLVVQSVFRATARSPVAGTLTVSLRVEGDSARLEVEDAGGPASEPFPESLEALSLLSKELGGDARAAGGTLSVRMPLA